MNVKSVNELKNAADLSIELLLYFPPKKAGQMILPGMWKVGRIVDFPFRPPSHWALLPREPQ